MQELQILFSQSSEIAEKAQDIADKIKNILDHNAIENNHVIHQGNLFDPFIALFTIFILAMFVGYYIVSKVTPSLHAPLMSITNAISGIIVITPIIVASSSKYFCVSSLLSYFALFFATINIFGGFILTQRMIQMFNQKK